MGRLSVAGVSKSFDINGQRIQALRDVDLTLNEASSAL